MKRILYGRAACGKPRGHTFPGRRSIPHLAAAMAALMLASCADNITGRDDGRWLVTNRAGETDYELAGALLLPHNSAELSKNPYNMVARVAADAKKRPRARIEVQGFADTSGTRDDNMVVSQARAEKVASVLVRHGISAGRILARGYGEERLAVRTGDGVRDQRNRRVVIRIIG